MPATTRVGVSALKDPTKLDALPCNGGWQPRQKMPPEVLATLAVHEDLSVRAEVVSNPSVLLAMLQQMKSDHYERIAKTASRCYRQQTRKSMLNKLALLFPKQKRRRPDDADVRPQRLHRR